MRFEPECCSPEVQREQRPAHREFLRHRPIRERRLHRACRDIRRACRGNRQAHLRRCRPLDFPHPEPSNHRDHPHLAAFRDNRQARLVYCHRVYRPERREPSCPAAVHRPERPEPSCPAAAGCHLLRNPAEDFHPNSPAEDFRPNSRAAGCRQSIPEEDYHPSNQQAGCHLRTPAGDCRSNRRWA